MEKIKIILVDKRRNIRGNIRSMIDQIKFVEVVGVAESSDEVLCLIDRFKPHIIVSDIVIPAEACITAIEHVTVRNPTLRFIMLSQEIERDYLIRAIQAGVSGFILKNLDPNELELAIKTVYRGAKYFSAGICEMLAEAISSVQQSSDYDMTDREKAILKLVSLGNSSKEIAGVLAISSRTVESYRVRLLKRLGVANTAQLIMKSSHLHLV